MVHRIDCRKVIVTGGDCRWELGRLVMLGNMDLGTSTCVPSSLAAVALKECVDLLLRAMVAVDAVAAALIAELGVVPPLL